MKKILILILLPVQMVFGQNETTLNQCYLWAHENYPNLKNSEIWTEISQLNKLNFETNYLPSVKLNAQVTYQSDVTGINIPLPNVEIPSVSKDQYKAYAEFRQNIWDGGITNLNKKLEEALLTTNLNQLEVELYKLNSQLAQAFFSALITQQQQNVLQAQQIVLEQQLKEMNAAISNGMAETAAALALKAELLKMKQQKTEMEALHKTAISFLSVLTGKEKDVFTNLLIPQPRPTVINTLSRPEFTLFEAQKNQLNTQINILEKSRNPKIFSFGQAGFGKPALNMLNDEFDAYYLVGVGVSWNVLDWKNTSRKKQSLQFNQEIIENSEKTFRQNIQLMLEEQNQQIQKFKTLLETDREIVALRAEISKAAASKLKNEIITSSAYIQEIQAETAAKLNLEIHRMQLLEAGEKYDLIAGKSELLQK